MAVLAAVKDNAPEAIKSLFLNGEATVVLFKPKDQMNKAKNKNTLN